MAMNERELTLVFGYIHRMEIKWKDLSIPEPIVLLFALYYIPKAEFDLSMKSMNMIISGDNNEFVHNNLPNTIGWRSIFGKRVFKGYGKYEWNLEIIEAGDAVNSWQIMVGIIKNEYCARRKEESAFGNEVSIGLVGSQRGITEFGIVDSEYGELFNQVGDTVKMVLDLDELTLSYTINGTDYGPAITKDKSYNFGINKDTEYRFALSLISGRKLRLSD